jgi:hypothetical protein
LSILSPEQLRASYNVEPENEFERGQLVVEKKVADVLLAIGMDTQQGFLGWPEVADRLPTDADA